MGEIWNLDPDIRYLNHGSFGACPSVVLEKQGELRAELEREPVRFFLRRYQPLLEEARDKLSTFLGADPANLVFVNNATFGVNSVLRSLDLNPGDELLTTSQAYNACRNALEFVAERASAKVVVAELPFPVESPAQIAESIISALTPRTRLLLLDHITSSTGLILPIDMIVPAVQERGAAVLVDAAHAPGMLPLELEALGADYTTGNAHKWLCAPKGAAFLHVSKKRRSKLRPAVISHGASMPTEARSRFHQEFDWVGTQDPTAWLSIPCALETMRALLPGGWPEIRRRNHELVLAGRDLLCETLALSAPAPDSMIGSLAAIPLPDGPANPRATLYADPLQERLLDHHGIEVPISPWPHPPKRLLRVSAQLYNELGDYEHLAHALSLELSAKN